MVVHAATVPPPPTLAPLASVQHPLGSVATRVSDDPSGDSFSSTSSRLRVGCPAESATAFSAPVTNSVPSRPQPAGTSGVALGANRVKCPVLRSTTITAPAPADQYAAR